MKRLALALLLSALLSTSCLHRRSAGPGQPPAPSVLETIWKVAEPHVEELLSDLARLLLGKLLGPESVPTPGPPP